MAVIPTKNKQTVNHKEKTHKNSRGKYSCEDLKHTTYRSSKNRQMNTNDQASKKYIPVHAYYVFENESRVS